MSRLAAKPIAFSDSVTVESKDDEIKIKGPRGENTVKMVSGVDVRVEDNKIHVKTGEKTHPAYQGLVWSLIHNAVVGVTDGFSKKIEIVGKGWRSQVKGQVINLQVGYSQPVDFELPHGVNATQENPGSFVLHSHDKQLLGQVCANLQKIRPVEPYKLKGIRIEGQYLRKKVRKTAGV